MAKIGVALNGELAAYVAQAQQYTDGRLAERDRYQPAGTGGVNGSNFTGPNLIAGHSGNAVASDLSCCVIAGGGEANFENVIGAASTANVGTGNSNLPAATNTGADVSIIGGGYDNVANGLASVITAFHSKVESTASHGTIIGGSNHKIHDSDYGIVAGGTQGEVAADYSAVVGGQNNKASAMNTLATGLDADARIPGGVTRGAGKFLSAGDAQSTITVMKKQTVDANPHSLLATSLNLTLGIPDQTTWLFSALIVARRVDADGESAAYKLEGCVDRQTGANTTALVGAVAKTAIAEDAAAWDVGATADTTNGRLNLLVTGEAGKTINWVARVTLVEVTG